MEKTISVTDLVRNADAIVKDVEAAGTIYRITRGGRGSTVLVDQQYFDGWMAALEEMSRPGWREMHDRTTRDIAAGRGRDLEVVVKELGLENRPNTRRRKPARRVAGGRRAKGR